MPKILVTGINGFVGKHLARHLAHQGCEVGGVGREENIAPELENIVSHYQTCDLTDAPAVSRLDLRFDAVISLAGLANVGQSFGQADHYMQVNVAVASNLCQALLNQKLSPRIIAISSGAVYDSSQPMPLIETSRLGTGSSPYTQSKIAMERAVLEFRGNGLPECLAVRPFNHVGPGQETGFLVPDLYQKIIEAVKSGQPVMTGNLTTRRDYTDVRDVVRAYALLATIDFGRLSEPVYNVCSGQTHSGQEVLAEFKKHIPGTDKLKITTDPALIRPGDPQVLVGSNERLHQATGWKPEIPFTQTIADFVASKQV